MIGADESFTGPMLLWDWDDDGKPLGLDGEPSRRIDVCDVAVLRVSCDAWGALTSNGEKIKLNRLVLGDDWSDDCPWKTIKTKQLEKEFLIEK